jgi:hypothetical protein
MEKYKLEIKGLVIILIPLLLFFILFTIEKIVIWKKL